MSLEWGQFGSNDNRRNPRSDWYEKVTDLGNYRASMRHASLTCIGCGWVDYYLFYVRSGTEHIKCRKCRNDNCLADHPERV